MNNEYEQAVQYIRENLALGYPPDQIQRQLVGSGWNEGLVNRALGQALSTPLATPQSHAKRTGKQTIGVIFIMIASIVTVVLFFVVQTRPSGTPPATNESSVVDTNEMTDSGDETRDYVSSEARASFAYPNEWILSDLTGDDTDVFHWQIESPDSQSVALELEREYTTGPGGDLQTALEKAIDDPRIKKIAIVDIQLKKEPTFEVEKDIDAWKKVADAVNALPDTTLKDFEEIKVAGFDGLKYTLVEKDGDTQSSSVNYVVILPGQRLEVSVFPGNSEHIITIESILESFTIATS